MDKTTAINTSKSYLQYLINEKKLIIHRAFLFGSYAKGNNHFGSDIDLALIFPGVQDKYDLMAKLLYFRRSSDIDIEPHPFNESEFTVDEPLVSEIVQTGIEIEF